MIFNKIKELKEQGKRIEKTQVTAKIRKLKASWTLGTAQKMGVFRDIEQELMDALLATLFNKIQYLGINGPTQWSVYEVDSEAADWIKEQPSDMWIRIEDNINEYPASFIYHFAVSPELETWMKLKFS